MHLLRVRGLMTVGTLSTSTGLSVHPQHWRHGEAGQFTPYLLNYPSFPFPSYPCVIIANKQHTVVCAADKFYRHTISVLACCLFCLSHIVVDVTFRHNLF